MPVVSVLSDEQISAIGDTMDLRKIQPFHGPNRTVLCETSQRSLRSRSEEKSRLLTKPSRNRLYE